MSIPGLDELFYLVGFLLIFVPIQWIPISAGQTALGRVIKHGTGLVLFGAGTLGLHIRLRADWGQSFLVASILLLLVISLVRVWWLKREG